tara:strand:+ start:17363 stop:17830 length:468 start_codon:yes stop_codon:yes gene_type:complete
MITIATLIVIGLIFIFFEVIVPGGILGLLGAASFITAWVFAFELHGAMGTIVAFLASLLSAVIVLVLEFKYLPKTKLGKRFFLKTSVESQSTHEPADNTILGKTGHALTSLAPSGMVEIDGAQYEASSESGWIEEGTSIIVVQKDNFRLIVKSNP